MITVQIFSIFLFIWKIKLFFKNFFIRCYTHKAFVVIPRNLISDLYFDWIIFWTFHIPGNWFWRAKTRLESVSQIAHYSHCRAHKPWLSSETNWNKTGWDQDRLVRMFNLLFTIITAVVAIFQIEVEREA